MRKFLALFALAFLSASVVHASQQAVGYSKGEYQHSLVEHQVTEIFFNNSGSAVTSGMVVIQDTSGTGLNGGFAAGDGPANWTLDTDSSDGDVDNLGTYITTTTTADDERVAGIVLDDSCADQSYCKVVVRGPVRAICAGATDSVTAGATGAVGTTTVAANVGGGKGVGFALESSQTNDGAACMIWVQPGYGT